MYLIYNKPSYVMSYPKSMRISKKVVMKEKMKMQYPKAWRYIKTQTGGHKLKFSKRDFKKHYVITPKKIRETNLGYNYGDYF